MDDNALVSNVAKAAEFAALNNGWKWGVGGARLSRKFPSGEVWVYWIKDKGWLVGPPWSHMEADADERGTYDEPEAAVLAAEVIYG